MSTPPMRADAPDDVLAAFHDIDGRLPEGFRTQLVNGEIVVSHLPDGEHVTIISRVMQQVYRQAEGDLYCSGHRGLIIPGGRFIPDCTIAPAGHFRGRSPWVPADGVAMVVEVTSSDTSDRERLQKPCGYAAAGIPLYLLVDRVKREILLCSKPYEDAYHAQLREPYGQGIDLPAPFAFTLDTADLF